MIKKLKNKLAIYLHFSLQINMIFLRKNCKKNPFNLLLIFLLYKKIETLFFELFQLFVNLHH